MELNLNAIKPGIKFEMEKQTLAEDSASRYDSGLVDVFSTPAMVALMEGTSYRCVMPFLPEGYSTVGTEVNVRHLKATPIGMKVRCKSILKILDGKRLVFEVNAWDEKGLIGEGTHERYIIDLKKFISRLQED